MEYAAQLGSVYGAEVRPHHRTKFGAVLCRMLGCCCNTTTLLRRNLIGSYLQMITITTVFEDNNKSNYVRKVYQFEIS